MASATPSQTRAELPTRGPNHANQPEPHSGADRLSFSEVSEGAVNYAFDLVEKFEARVTLMHVPDLKALEDDARSRLDTVAALAKKRGIEASTAWSHGTPFVEIIRLAREAEVDLIVAGTHGRGPITHLLLGSVAENLVRQAPCPVLTVRQGEQKFEMP